MYTKSVVVFLVATFGLGVAVQLGLYWAGLLVHRDPTFINTIILALVMFVPALGALIARNLADDDILEDGTENLWPVPFWPAVVLGLGIPLVVALGYGLDALLGSVTLDWNMGVLTRELRETGLVTDLSPEVAAIGPPLYIVAGTLFSALIGVVLYGAVFLGNEYGWRAYLLPRLLPLGRWPAYAILGVVVWLWYLPLLLTFYVVHRDLSTILVDMGILLVFSLIFNAFLGELWRLSGHIGLTAIAAGALVAQHQQGVWKYLFVTVRDWSAGPFGVTAIALWALMIPVLWFVYPKLTGKAASSK